MVGLGAWVGAAVEGQTSDFFIAYQRQSNGNYILLFERIAGQTSVLLESSSSHDIANVTGVAYGTETYVQVRWL